MFSRRVQLEVPDNQCDQNMQLQVREPSTPASSQTIAKGEYRARRRVILATLRKPALGEKLISVIFVPLRPC
jgi:hypothetical protein